MPPPLTVRICPLIQPVGGGAERKGGVGDVFRVPQPIDGCVSKHGLACTIGRGPCGSFASQWRQERILTKRLSMGFLCCPMGISDFPLLLCDN